MSLIKINTDPATFWATFVKGSATFYSIIWSHWSGVARLVLNNQLLRYLVSVARGNDRE